MFVCDYQSGGRGEDGEKKDKKSESWKNKVRQWTDSEVKTVGNCLAEKIHSIHSRISHVWGLSSTKSQILELPLI